MGAEIFNNQIIRKEMYQTKEFLVASPLCYESNLLLIKYGAKSLYDTLFYPLDSMFVYFFIKTVTMNHLP